MCLVWILKVAPRLVAFVDELVGMLHQRGDAIAARLNQPGVTGAAEIADFLMLQLINRAEPLALHMAKETGLHPEELYRAVVQIAGEMATFANSNKRPREYPVYQHDKLRESFAPIIEDLRKYLSIVMDSHAVSIKLEERQHGIRVAMVPDTELLKSAAFVLAVSANLAAEVVRSGFPQHVKIGPIEKNSRLGQFAITRYWFASLASGTAPIAVSCGLYLF